MLKSMPQVVTTVGKRYYKKNKLARNGKVDCFEKKHANVKCEAVIENISINIYRSVHLMFTIIPLRLNLFTVLFFLSSAPNPLKFSHVNCCSSSWLCKYTMKSYPRSFSSSIRCIPSPVLGGE